MPFKDKAARYALSEKWRLRKVKEDPNYERRRNLYRKYRMHLGQYEIMLKAQGGVCAICGDAPSEKHKLCVDHDHKSGKVRGLLCHACNKGIGMLKDSLTVIYAAARYLELASIV